MFRNRAIDNLLTARTDDFDLDEGVLGFESGGQRF
jgi:hypothetical protein